MKRAISSIVFVGAVAFSFAGQGSFTIVRPLDGSTVREKTRILVPKNSVQDSGYIGIFRVSPELPVIIDRQLFGIEPHGTRRRLAHLGTR